MADADYSQWWVIPVARLTLRSALSYEDMHGRLESLFDTDDRIIAKFAPSLPPRRPFAGYARFGEVTLLERIQRGNRRERTTLVARGRVEALPAGSRLVLWFRPPTYTVVVLTLGLLWMSFSALRDGASGSTSVGFGMLAVIYFLAVVEFWWRAQRAARVVRRAFNA